MQGHSFARKMTISEIIYSAFGTTVTRTSAFYRLAEVIPKVSLISTGVKKWSHEYVCTREPIRKFVLAMTKNEAFLGDKRVNVLHLQKFNLNSLTVYLFGFPVVGIPHQTEYDRKLYLKSIQALAFGQHGHGVSYNDYANHYVLLFHLTSTQLASYDYRYQKLTNGSFSVSLRFSA